VSTYELAVRMGVALRRRPRLVPVPVSILKLAGRVTGKRGAVISLTETSTVDTTRLKTLVGWNPPFTMQAGLERTAHWYRAGRSPVRP
jgi:UDP-glucose 4-epimerase